jgi:uncharacterized protein GlcG (DUF336 family)
MQLTYSKATELLQAALTKAEEINVPVSVAVMDSGRELLAFARQDGAPLLSTEIAQGKAFTSRSLNMPTSQVGPLTQPGGPLFGLEVASRHLLVTFAGGQPLSADGVVIGAIGVSGGTVEQDDEIALFALESLNSLESVNP